MTHNSQLEQWLAQEREITARMDAGAGPGVARPDQIAGMTGLQMMQAMLRGELPYAPIARTLDFLMRKRVVGADEALAMGLVNEVVDDAALIERARALAIELAEGPQVAMRLLKRAVYNAAHLSYHQAGEDIAARTGISDHHPDAIEGARAWAEKRKPRFNQES